MKLGKIDKFILLYMHEDRQIQDSRRLIEPGIVDRSHLILQFYFIKKNIFNINYKGTVKSAMPARDYATLQSSFSRSLKKLLDSGLVQYSQPVGRQSNRVLTERRIGIRLTDAGTVEMQRMVARARKTLGDHNAKMIRKNIKIALGI